MPVFKCPTYQHELTASHYQRMAALAHKEIARIEYPYVKVMWQLYAAADYRMARQAMGLVDELGNQ